MFTLNYAQRCMIYCNNSTIERHTVERIDSHDKEVWNSSSNPI